MAKRSEHIRNEHGEVEGCFDLGGRPGYEFQAPDGERRDGMVWVSFEGLNDAFDIEGVPGEWIERYGRTWDRGSHNSQKYTFDGVTYPTMTEAAEALGVTRQAISNRIKKGAKPRGVVIEGVKYKNIYTAARAYNMPPTSFRRKYL